jgi:hypothetical protein
MSMKAARSSAPAGTTRLRVRVERTRRPEMNLVVDQYRSGFNRSMQHHGEWWRIDREVGRWRRRAGQV